MRSLAFPIAIALLVAGLARAETHEEPSPLPDGAVASVHGRILTHEELMQRGGAYCRFVELQTRGAA